jgi:hypothetical protein
MRAHDSTEEKAVMAIEIAKYRTLKYVDGGYGIIEPPDKIIERKTWPRHLDCVEPLNDAARQIVAYYRLHHNTTFQMPANPYTGEGGGTLHLPLPQNVPLWKSDHIGSIMGADVFFTGSPFASPNWPEPGGTPLNNTAKAVAEYFKKHADDPALPAAGWDVENACLNTIEHAAKIEREGGVRAAMLERRRKERELHISYTRFETGGPINFAFISKLGGNGDMSRSNPLIIDADGRVSIKVGGPLSATAA